MGSIRSHINYKETANAHYVKDCEMAGRRGPPPAPAGTPGKTRRLLDRTGQAGIMALPGNPVSALTGLNAFVLPALAVASGLAIPRQRLVISHERIDGLPGGTHRLPVALGDGGRASPAPSGNSGDFIGLLRIDGFITFPPRGGIAAAFPFAPWF